ncbi:MAG: hypothetical protein ABI945_03065 [Nitrospirales bacterium]
MAHIATRVLPLITAYTRSVAESPIGEGTRGATLVRPSAPVLPDLEVAYGIISGLVFGLLGWVGLLLPALYFLL